MNSYNILKYSALFIMPIIYLIVDLSNYFPAYLFKICIYRLIKQSNHLDH